LPDPNRTEAAEAARVAQQPPFDAQALVAVLVSAREDRIHILFPQSERLEHVAGSP
jgi:hypothetical protein